MAAKSDLGQIRIHFLDADTPPLAVAMRQAMGDDGLVFDTPVDVPVLLPGGDVVQVSARVRARPDGIHSEVTLLEDGLPMVSLNCASALSLDYGCRGGQRLRVLIGTGPWEA